MPRTSGNDLRISSRRPTRVNQREIYVSTTTRRNFLRTSLSISGWEADATPLPSQLPFAIEIPPRTVERTRRRLTHVFFSVIACNRGTCKQRGTRTRESPFLSREAPDARVERGGEVRWGRRHSRDRVVSRDDTGRFIAAVHRARYRARARGRTQKRNSKVAGESVECARAHARTWLAASASVAAAHTSGLPSFPPRRCSSTFTCRRFLLAYSRINSPPDDLCTFPLSPDLWVRPAEVSGFNRKNGS